MKKIISILLVLTVLVNVIGFGFFNVHTEAVFVEVASSVVLSLVAGAILGGLSGLAADAIESNQYKFFQEHENLIEKINNHAIENGDLIQVNERRNSDGSYTYWIEPVSGLTDDEQEFVQDICDSVNNGSGLDSFVTSYLAYNSGDDLDHGAKASASSYAAFKSDVTNAFCDYVNKKALGDAFTSEMISDYQLDWKTGGVPTIKLPSVAQYMESTYSGYTFSTPLMLERDDGLFYTDGLGSQFGMHLEWKGGSKEDGFKYQWTFDESKGVYGYGQYIIYNNKLYFCGFYINDEYCDGTVYSTNFDKWYVDRGNFVAADGENLKDVYGGSVSGLQAGMYFVTQKGNALQPSITVNGSDLMSDAGSNAVGIPLTDDEQTVAAAMSLPILSADPVLTIGSDGKITAVDGIDTSTLEGIVDNIAENGDEISFANNKEAIAYLTKVVEAVSKNSKDTDQIINNLYDLLIDVDLTALNESINGIRTLNETEVDKLTSIEEQTAAIAEALELSKEAEFERENFELDVLTGEHTGLAEANEFVSKWTLVNQCKELVSNVLDGGRYSSSAPSFKFYWDSNNDGVTEEYTAFDLSMLEQTLDNSNLSDKNRFTKPMTVREFIQLLIIFICYIGFAIKMLRKLPGLVSGGESTAGDGLELKSVRNVQAQISAINRGDPGM